MIPDFLMKTFEFEDSKSGPASRYYRLGCSCASQDCDIEVCVEDTGGFADLTFTVKATTKTYHRPTPYTWLNDIINRVTVAFKILVFGEVHQYKEFLLDRSNVKALRFLCDEVENVGHHKEVDKPAPHTM